MTMQAGAPIDLHAARPAGPERLDDLIQEVRDAVVDLCVTGGRNRPAGHLGAATRDDLFPVQRDELVEHEHLPHALSAGCSLGERRGAAGQSTRQTAARWLERITTLRSGPEKVGLFA